MKGAVVVDPTVPRTIQSSAESVGNVEGEVVGRRTVQIARFSWRRVNRRLHSLS